MPAPPEIARERAATQIAPASLVDRPELSRRSGVAEATLARWEAEHGFPSSLLTSAGREFYAADDEQLLRQAVAERDTGAALGTALAAARTASWVAGHSVFFAIRRAHPELTSHVLAKPAVVALCRAIEDEAHRSATQPVLIGSFQRERYYRQSEQRWRQLAAGTRLAVAFAEFATADGAASSPVEIAGSWGDPFIREWFVLCHAADLRAVVVAWERPTAPGTPDAERRFETLWTTNTAVVDIAFAAAHARLAAHSQQLAADVRTALRRPAAPTQGTVTPQELLVQRIFAYLAARSST